MAFLQKNISVMRQVRRINKQLEGVPQKCEGPVGDTLFLQASLVATEQRSLVAVGETGDLKASIRVEAGKKTAKKAIVVNIKAGGALTLDDSGKPYDHARANEFGTQYMPAQPFFFPVWRARKKEAKAAVRKAVKLAVSKVFK